MVASEQRRTTFHPPYPPMGRNLILRLERVRIPFQPRDRECTASTKENTNRFPLNAYHQQSVPSTSRYHVKEETQCLFHSELDFQDDGAVEYQTRCQCGNCSPLYENKEREQRQLLLQQMQYANFDDLPPLKNITESVQTQTTAPVKKYKFTCEVCQSQFNNLDYFRHHETAHYSKMYGCPYCNATFVSKTKLKNHVFQHLNKNFYQCVYCRAAFENKHDLMDHVRTHRITKMWSCKVCPAKFDNSKDLEQHQLKHQYRSSGNLVHVFRKIRDPKSAVLPPVTSATNNKPSTFFSCKKCKKLSFSGISSFRRHEMIHKRTVGASACEICDARFAYPNHLNAHRKAAH